MISNCISSTWEAPWSSHKCWCAQTFTMCSYPSQMIYWWPWLTAMTSSLACWTHLKATSGLKQVFPRHKSLASSAPWALLIRSVSTLVERWCYFKFHLHHLDTPYCRSTTRLQMIFQLSSPLAHLSFRIQPWITLMTKFQLICLFSLMARSSSRTWWLWSN